jgi:predicted transcriptional regulator of viral defense system
MYRINKQHSGKITSGKRIADIATLGEIVFHAGDAANIWNIRNKNTLHKTLSRYVGKGMVYRIYKGLYSTKPIDDIDPYLLGVKALHGSAYISCESILFDNGVINQPPKEITLVSVLSKRFTIGGHVFRSRKLNDRFLSNTTGITMSGEVYMASLSRAVADMLHFNSKKYLDASNSKIIDWKDVSSIAREVGYNISIPKNI